MATLASPQVVGRYALYDKIAAGGMATVHFGRLLGAAGFARTVAVKRLHPHLADEPEFVSTMIDEARLAARISHPNVVSTLDVVTTGDELLIVMEYVRGESLARLLRTESSRGRHVPLPIVSAVVIGALHGLHAAHEATSDRGTPLGIVHRDMSPHNVLVGLDGMARVIDFGVAKAAGRLQTTRDGVIKGKVAYMAPEQLSASEVTRAVDVYAMGVVLWELLTGRRLFRAASEVALFRVALAGAKDPPSRYAPNVPKELDDLVMTALALDPAARFPTAKDMAERLLRIVPPAFPTVVGEWVGQVAEAALKERGETLAEIESRSDLVVVPPSKDTSEGRSADLAGRAGDDDAPTVASQPSILTLETPKPSVAPVFPSRRVRLLGALFFAALFAAVAVALALRGARAPRKPALASAPPALTALPPQAPASASEPVPSASGSGPLPLPPPPSATRKSAPAVVAPPVTTVAKPRPAPTPSIRFAQPD